jgi:hypothetical protein
MKAWKRAHTMRTGKIFTIVLAAVALLLSTGGAGHAIGEFAIGLNGGLACDPNNLEDEITRYNLEMSQYEENNAGASSTAMAIPYSPVYGFNVRYQLNFFFLRLGCHYSSPLQDAKGSVTTAAGVKNSIKISTYQLPSRRHWGFWFHSTGGRTCTSGPVPRCIRRGLRSLSPIPIPRL